MKKNLHRSSGVLATTRRTVAVVATAAALSATVGVSAVEARTDEGAREILLPSALENTETDVASLPVREARVGSYQGAWASFVITESSSRDLARRWGVTWSPKPEQRRQQRCGATGTVRPGPARGRGHSRLLANPRGRART